MSKVPFSNKFTAISLIVFIASFLFVAINYNFSVNFEPLKLKIGVLFLVVSLVFVAASLLSADSLKGDY